MTYSSPASPAKKLLHALLRNRRSRSFTQRFGGLFLRYLPGQITCRQFETFVIDYHENRLTDSQRELIERHMRLCPMCRTSLAGYLKTIELGKKTHPNYWKNATLVDAPYELVETILSAPTDHAARPQ